jgi:DNA-binding PadR family transcriptional regulator
VTEQIYLIAIWHLKENAYGVKIREKILALTGKSMVFGTLYNNLDTLVKKGYVETRKGSSGPNRGGNIRVFYSLTKVGETALQQSRELHRSLWESIPESAFLKR